MKNKNDYIREIKKLIQAKKYEEAKEKVIEELKFLPDNPYLLFQYGLILKYEKKLDEAFSCFKYVYDLDKNNKYSALHQMGLIKREQNDFEKAEGYFTKIIRESKYPEIFSVIELCKIEEKKGNYKGAIKILESVSKLKDSHADYARIQLARLKIVDQKVDEADEILKEVTHDHGREFERELLHLQGRAAFEKKEYSKALAFFKMAKGVTRDKIYWINSLEEAKTYEKMDQLEQALKVCADLEKSEYKDNPRLHMLLGDVYRKQENYKEASKEYNLALNESQLDTFKQGIYLRQGLLKIERDNLDGAIPIFEKIVNYNTKEYQEIAYMELADIYTRKKDYNNAKQSLRKLKEIKPNPDLVKTINRSELWINTQTKSKFDRKDFSYIEHQMIHYSEEHALEHIRRGHTEDNTAVFKNDSDIETIFYGISPLLSKTRRMVEHATDCYVVDYPKVGTVQHEDVDKLKVVCLPNTHKVITMYPYKKNMQEENLEQDFEAKPKEKRLSQIEKFYRRYGNKS